MNIHFFLQRNRKRAQKQLDLQKNLLQTTIMVFPVDLTIHSTSLLLFWGRKMIALSQTKWLLLKYLRIIYYNRIRSCDSWLKNSHKRCLQNSMYSFGFQYKVSIQSWEAPLERQVVVPTEIERTFMTAVISLDSCIFVWQKIVTRNSFDIDEENFHSFFFSIDKKRNRKETGWIHMLSFYAVHEKMILPSKRIGSKNKSTVDIRGVPREDT